QGGAREKGAGGGAAGGVLGTFERYSPRHVHVDLAHALQAPFQPLRRALMLDALAGRVRRSADGAERLVEIGDRLRRQTANGLLSRARDAIDFRGINRPPLAGAQSVGGGSLGSAKEKRQNRHTGTRAMKTHSSHLSDIPATHVERADDNSVLGRGSCPVLRRAENHPVVNCHCALMLAARMTFAHLSISHRIRSANSLGVLAIG